jgi:hypothetical protein
MRSFTVIGLVLAFLPVRAAAWNPPAHIVTGSIAYRTLLQDPDQRAILAMIRPFLYVKSLDPDGALQRQTQNLTAREADEMRFIVTAAWADLVRKADPAQHRDRWHYINWPFKPEGEPASIVPRPPHSENILAALAHNERVLQSARSQDQRAIAFAWILHLVGDVHQLLHAAQLFTREYREGDRGGNEICVRVAPDSGPINLHMLWDGLITSSGDTRALTNIAAELRKKFPKPRLTELAAGEPNVWAKESYELAKKIAYMNGNLRGTPKGRYRECGEVSHAAVLPRGYVMKAKEIAERRTALAGYRLANLLMKVCRQSICGKAQSKAASAS